MEWTATGPKCKLCSREATSGQPWKAASCVNNKYDCWISGPWKIYYVFWKECALQAQCLRRTPGVPHAYSETELGSVQCWTQMSVRLLVISSWHWYKVLYNQDCWRSQFAFHGMSQAGTPDGAWTGHIQWKARRFKSDAASQQFSDSIVIIYSTHV
jgi:hypothetical protein